MDPNKLFILDNGAHSIKLSNLSNAEPVIHRNAIIKSKAERRSYVGNELDTHCQDYGGLQFRIPFEKGILTNWDVQKTIWDHVFSTSSIEPTTSSLLVTEPVLDLPNVSDAYDQMIFEEYDFAAYLRCPTSVLLGAGEGMGEAILVVDTGFSRTDIVPLLKGRIVGSGVKRIDVGGKLLTNYMKELISFRQWYMMDQTPVVEKAKEETCFVTRQWEVDWERARPSNSDNTIVRTYVLPDFVPTSSNKLGYLKPLPGEEENDATSKGIGKASSPGPAAAPPAEEQLMHLSNERFTVPEVLFNPSTIGMNQAGIPESIKQSIEALPIDLRGMFWGNIVVTGGNSGFPGFKERLESDLRKLAPTDYDVRVSFSSSPTLAPLLAARHHLLSPPTSNPSILLENFATRQEYAEMGGLQLTRKKFGRVYWGSGEVEAMLKGD